eukprot:1082011-Pyramimonas_sp.AAC.1
MWRSVGTEYRQRFGGIFETLCAEWYTCVDSRRLSTVESTSKAFWAVDSGACGAWYHRGVRVSIWLVTSTKSRPGTAPPIDHSARRSAGKPPPGTATRPGLSRRAYSRIAPADW